MIYTTKTIKNRIRIAEIYLEVPISKPEAFDWENTLFSRTEAQVNVIRMSRNAVLGSNETLRIAFLKVMLIRDNKKITNRIVLKIQSVQLRIAPEGN
jgi:hypothetical protein